MSRRDHWAVVMALLAAAATASYVLYAIYYRRAIRVETSAENAEVHSRPPPAAPHSKVPTPKPSSTSLTNVIQEVQTKATIEAIPKLKAMPAQEVRAEFNKAASVLRTFLQSPPDEEIQKILRHPPETMLRYREWSRTRRIIPALPLQIGPQFGVSGSLFITGVKMNDGSLRLAALEKTSRGYLLDWESFSVWGERRFVELAQLGPDQSAVMRVTMKPSSAAPPESAPSGATFTLSHPDERTTLAAYATAEVLESNAAAKLLSNASGGIFILRLGMNENDIRQGQVRIHEVICSGWMPELSSEPSTKPPPK